MSGPGFPKFSSLQGELQLLIWDEAALEARGGPRVYSFNLVSETNQLVEADLIRDNVNYTEVHGPILSPGAELRADTKDQRALLMACYDSRQVMLKYLPDRINFTRSRQPHEPADYFDPGCQYPLFFNAKVDIICLPAHQVRDCHEAARYQVVAHPQADKQVWFHGENNTDTNWPIWRQLENIAIDVTNISVSLHMSRKALEPTLYRAISSILYHPDSMASNLRLFLANFGPVQYGDDGRPIDMAIDQTQPEYRSGLLAKYSFIWFGMSVEDMWVALDEGQCLRCPDWARERFGGPMGRPARLLVPSEDGQRIVVVGSVTEPADDGDDDDDEEDVDDDEEDVDEEEEDVDEDFVAEFGQMFGDAF